MKTRTLLVLGAALLLASARVAATDVPNSTATKIGVYDSRLLAYAHFWSEPATRERNELIAQARAAKTAADPDRFHKLDVQLVAMQRRSHLQVFSTAPADEAMAALHERLPALQRELGVGRLVSRWDEPALATVPDADRIDVTDRLLREFLPHPSDYHQKVIASMKDAKPLPLAEATKLADEGKL
ncbi:MAG TPA: hypothetical protein VG734_22100 [Lacunisphaera sp.]|nr:hypothetical protein [Lacunisphaera sp.]